MSEVGPKLGDALFFGELLDTARASLATIPKMIGQGNVVAARHAFAKVVREELQPDRYLRLPLDLGDNTFMYEDESLAVAAERILAGTLLSCGVPHTFPDKVDWSVNPTPNQYQEWTWQLNRHRDWIVLAERYRQTGEERYARGIVHFFRSWVRQAVVPENAPGQVTDSWRTIEAGIRMSGPWQWALHRLIHSPSLTDDDLVDWCKSIWEHGWRLRHFHRTGNWLVMEMNGLAQIGLLFPQLKEAAAWKQYAFEVLASELKRQVHPDGFQYELSTHTHQILLRNYRQLATLCRLYGEPVPSAFHEALERMYEVNIKMMMPDGRLPNVNNGGWHEVAALLEPAVEHYPERADFLWAVSKGRQGEPPAYTSYAFPHAGYHLMRTGWSSDAVWGLFDAGPLGYRHHHEDKLNLLVHAYGRLLLTDAGKFAFDESPMHRYTLSTLAHNTILVDGQGQNRRRRFVADEVNVRAPSGAQWVSQADRDIAEGFYNEGYGPEADRCVIHKRRVIFLKQHLHLAPCFLVIDRLLPIDGRSHRYEAIWHLDVEVVKKDGQIVSSEDAGQANMLIMPSLLPGLELGLVRGQTSPHWQGWKAVEQGITVDAQPISTAVYCWNAVEATRLVTLLFPLQAGASCPVVTISASQQVDDTEIQLLLKDGSIVELDEALFNLMLN